MQLSASDQGDLNITLSPVMETAADRSVTLHQSSEDIADLDF